MDYYLLKKLGAKPAKFNAYFIFPALLILICSIGFWLAFEAFQSGEQQLAVVLISVTLIAVVLIIRAIGWMSVQIKKHLAAK